MDLNLVAVPDVDASCHPALVHLQVDGEEVAQVLVPFSFEEANQKEDRNFHHQGGDHLAKIHLPPEEGESSLDGDAQKVEVLVMVNNPHVTVGSVQAVSIAYQIHRKEFLLCGEGDVPHTRIFDHNVPCVKAVVVHVCPSLASSSHVTLETESLDYRHVTPARGDHHSHIRSMIFHVCVAGVTQECGQNLSSTRPNSLIRHQRCRASSELMLETANYS